MKIGDRVKFLTETGGGVVSGFRDKDTVLVEDSDGFEIPMRISDVVVESGSDYDGGTWEAKKASAAGKPAHKPAIKSGSGAGASAAAAEAGNGVSRDTVKGVKAVETHYAAFPVERSGGEKLNVSLAFLPEASGENGGSGFEVYIINDSNYFVTLQWLEASGAAWKARYGATLEPNTKEYIETVRGERIASLERTALQLIACKREKPFDLKPALSIEMRFDVSRLYKSGAYRSNPYFDEPAIIVDAVKDDRAVRTLFADASQIERALMGEGHAKTGVPHTDEAVREKDKGLIEVDLHAAALFDSDKGLSDADIHNAQRHKMEEIMEKYRRRKGTRIIFIHGKGAGVLKSDLLHLLRSRYPSCTTQDASYSQYGFGATMVIVR